MNTKKIPKKENIMWLQVRSGPGHGGLGKLVFWDNYHANSSKHAKVQAANKIQNDAAPGNEDEPNPIVSAAHRAFEILFSSAGQEITMFIDQQFCPLVCTLLLSIGSVNCALKCDGMENGSAIDALKQLFTRACANNLIEKNLLLH